MLRNQCTVDVRWLYTVCRDASSWLASLGPTLDARLACYSPVQLILGTLCVSFLVRLFIASIVSLRALISRQSSGFGPGTTALRVVATIVADLPIIRGIVANEQAKVIRKLRVDMRKSRAATGVTPILSLPVHSTKQKQQLLRMIDKKREALGEARKKANRRSKASGAVYVGDSVLENVLENVYTSFSLSNPMHSIFPTCRQMEAEVIQMTASLVGGGGGSAATCDDTCGDNDRRCGGRKIASARIICGSMTSGGTESILTAVKASRDYMREKKRITRPEMVIAPSAHAAFIKAAEYFNIVPIKAPLDDGYRLTANSVKKRLTRNTVLVVASAVGYPHGVLDDVAGIAELCKKRGVLLHVDCCLGGFVLPFLKHLSPDIGGVKDLQFDFTLQGVTSMSLDVHKFGCSHKGTSVVLYRSPEIRRHQYTSITDWSGGLYISPGFAGSRNGALIATAWASMVYHGLEGFVENTARMMRCATRFKQAIENELSEYLELVGNPLMSVVAFTSMPGKRNIYVVNDVLTKKGWKMSALQNPPALHMCFTPAHSTEITEELIRDLRDAYMDGDRTANNEDDDEGLAPLYGMATKVPDKRIIGNFLIAYQDLLLEA